MTYRLIPVPPFDYVVFGATGDLARRKLMPALYHRLRDGQIVDGSRIIGVSRREMSDDEYRAMMREALDQFLPAEDKDAAVIDRFLGMLFYVAADVSGDAGWDRLKALLDDGADKVRAFYLAVGPDLFTEICAGIGRHGLVTPETRVVIEKPVGKDLASAEKVNEAVGAVFAEEQVFRIDHYLGKETVQNLMVLRFGNVLYEPLWNSAHVDHVQITVGETIGVGTRGGYYDTSGALRDMVQNHMLQLLCLVAMEPPDSFDANAVRDEKLKILKALKPIAGDDADIVTVRGQYRAGAANGGAVPGYLEEIGEGEEQHGDLRRAEGRDLELALGGRAVLPAHRKAPAGARVGDRRRLQADPALDLPQGRRHGAGQPAGAPPAAGRGREAVDHDQGPRPRRHAGAPRAARHELRRRLPRAQSRRLRAAAPRRGPRQPDALHAPRRGGGGVALDRSDPRGLGARPATAPKPYVAGSWGPSAAIALIERDGRTWHEE